MTCVNDAAFNQAAEYKCLGSQCMAWRWWDGKLTLDDEAGTLVPNEHRTGYCGLAGKPRSIGKAIRILGQSENAHRDRSTVMKISEQQWMIEHRNGEPGTRIYDAEGMIIAEMFYASDQSLKAIAKLPDLLRKLDAVRKQISRWQEQVYIEDCCVEMTEEIDAIDAMLSDDDFGDESTDPQVPPTPSATSGGKS